MNHEIDKIPKTGAKNFIIFFSLVRSCFLNFFVDYNRKFCEENMLGATWISFVVLTITLSSPLIQAEEFELWKAIHLVFDIFNYFNRLEEDKQYNQKYGVIANESPDLKSLKSNSSVILNDTNVKYFEEKAKKNDMRAEIEKYRASFQELLGKAGLDQSDDNIPMMSYLNVLWTASNDNFN